MPTQTVECQELHQVIDALPDDSVITALELIRGLQSNAETDEWVDPIETGNLNAETLEAIRDVEEGRVERFESKEALFKDLGLC